MFNRVMLFVISSILILSLAGCGGGEEQKQQAQPAAAAAPAKPEEEKVPVYELTKDDITTHEGWTSRNISILGVKIGDKTRDVEKNLGAVENTRTLPKTETDPTAYYLTIYEGNGVFVYTAQLTGKVQKIEIYDTFTKKMVDEKLKKLLASGDSKTMHDVLGMEEDTPIENAEDKATEYRYDARGIRFVKFKVQGKTVNALRLMPAKKTT